MDFSVLKKYKDLFIENYDYSIQSEGSVWFHGVQLKEVPSVPFRFADSVIFEYDKTNLNVLFYQNDNGTPHEIKNLV